MFGLNGIIGDVTVQTLIRGLDQKKGVDLMAQPSVTTRSGQAASIEIVREFRHPTEYEPPELPQSVGSGQSNNEGGRRRVPGTPGTPGTTGTTGTTGGNGSIFPVTPATPTAFVTRDDVGITLEVLPVADANRRYVDITLNPVVTISMDS